MNAGSLQNMVAIVTGAGSGLGEGSAERFAAEGCAVIVNDTGRDESGRMAAAIRCRGRQAHFVGAGESKSADAAQPFAATLAHFGGLHIVVNHAGTTHRNRPPLEVTEEEFDRIDTVNLESIALAAQRIVPYFRQAGGRVFVNIASTAAVRPGLVWYNGAKATVIITGKGMAAEPGPDKSA